MQNSCKHVPRISLFLSLSQPVTLSRSLTRIDPFSLRLTSRICIQSDPEICSILESPVRLFRKVNFCPFHSRRVFPDPNHTLHDTCTPPHTWLPIRNMFSVLNTIQSIRGGVLIEYAKTLKLLSFIVDKSTLSDQFSNDRILVFFSFKIIQVPS